MSGENFTMPGEGTLFERNNEMWVKVTTEETGGVYEVCEEFCPPGFESKRHAHRKDYETFYMVEGSATWNVGDETIEATKGTFIKIPPNVPHKVVTKEGCRMLCIFGPGQQAAFFTEMNALSAEQQEDQTTVHAILDKHDVVPFE